MTKRGDDDEDELDLIYKDMASRWNGSHRKEPIEHFTTAKKLKSQLFLLNGFLSDMHRNPQGLTFIEEFQQQLDAWEWVGADGTWDDERLRSRGLFTEGEIVAVAVGLVADLMNRPGMSLREAVARSVAKNDVPGNSFEAACKRVERAYRERRRALDNGRRNKSNDNE